MNSKSIDTQKTTQESNDKWKKFVNSNYCNFLLATPASWNAELVTYPLDLIKTRMQIDGEGTKAIDFKKRGMFNIGYNIVLHEGPFKLWKGMSPALLRHVIYSGIRMSGYNYLRQLLSTTEKEQLSIWKQAFCGITAGVVGQGIASPTDLIKTQLQAEGRRAMRGEAPRVTGVIDAFQKVVAKGGYTALWVGAVPNMQRSAAVNLGDLTTYSVVKSWLLNNFQMADSYPVHFIASFTAGLVAAILATPIDTVKVRIMNQPTDEKGRGLLYKGTLDCFNKTIKTEGLFAVYKGFIPLWLRLGPWAIVMWMTFEHLRYLIGADGY